MYLDWKTDPREYFVVDIEGDSLWPSVLWCMCWLNLKTGEKGDCIGHEEILAFFEDRRGAVFVGHNMLKFDAVQLVRLHLAKLSASNCIDTLVLSQLYSPNLWHGHGLAAWGEQLGFPKGDFHDFSKLSEEMLVYCRQDVLITAKLFVRLMKTLERIGFTEQSIWIQHRFTIIIDRQHKNGFKFDGERAITLYNELRTLEEKLQDEIRLAFPAKRTFVAQRKLLRKDGSHTSQYEKDDFRYDIEFDPCGTTYRAYEDIEFNIGSPFQRIEKLLELGWIPEEFTEKTEKGGGGNPKPFDKGKMSPSLERFLENTPTPEVQLMAKWMAINGRANMIKTWLDNWDEDDGCIHGKLFLADTLRLRHQAPNTANIPAVRVKEHKDDEGKVVKKEVIRGEAGVFTYEARDLWVARKGRVLVGTDAAGLELRMLAHYLNRPAFTVQVVEGDPHQYNADQVGIPRPQAKTLIYAIMYGAGDVKIARTLGLPVLTRRDRKGRTYEVSPEGGRIKTMFLERLGLKELMEECQNEQKNGRVSLVDGSFVVCPSPHAALNYKLQGGGARVMACGAVLLDGSIRKNGFDSLKVGDIHDEWQFDVDPRDADYHAVSAVEAIRDAGETLSMSVPLWGESKIGRTWAETH